MTLLGCENLGISPKSPHSVFTYKEFLNNVNENVIEV